MPITANILYRDSFNFMRRQLPRILLLVLLSTLVTVILRQIFMPDTAQLKILLSSISENITLLENSQIDLDMVLKMTEQEKMLLFKISAATTFSNLIGNGLLIGTLLTLISRVSSGESSNLLHSINLAMPTLPRLFLLMFLCTITIQLGLMLLIVPGVMLAIAFSLAPIIIVNENKGILIAIKTSAKLAFLHTRLILPIMLLWIIVKFLVLLVIAHLPQFIAMSVLHIISKFMFAVVLIYLFRLYMLLRR